MREVGTTSVVQTTGTPCLRIHPKPNQDELEGLVDRENLPRFKDEGEAQR